MTTSQDHTTRLTRTLLRKTAVPIGVLSGIVIAHIVILAIDQLGFTHDEATRGGAVLAGLAIGLITGGVFYFFALIASVLIAASSDYPAATPTTNDA